MMLMSVIRQFTAETQRKQKAVNNFTPIPGILHAD